MNSFITINVPKYIGAYVINDELHFAFSKKPKIIHIFFTKLLLGWKWINYENI